MYDQVIKRIDDHAYQNYEKGWDGWIETMSKDEKIKVFKGGRWSDVPLGPEGYEMCFHRAVIWVADHAEIDAMKAEGCALYDVDPDFYKRIQANSKVCRQKAKESRVAIEELEERQYDEEVAAEDALEDPELIIQRNYPL